MDGKKRNVKAYSIMKDYRANMIYPSYSWVYIWVSSSQVFLSLFGHLHCLLALLLYKKRKEKVSDFVKKVPENCILPL